MINSIYRFDTVDCVGFITQKAVSKKIRSLDVEEVVYTLKIIDLDTKVSAEKTKMALVFKINSSDIHIAMTLIN